MSTFVVRVAKKILFFTVILKTIRRNAVENPYVEKKY